MYGLKERDLPSSTRDGRRNTDPTCTDGGFLLVEEVQDSSRNESSCLEKLAPPSGLHLVLKELKTVGLVCVMSASEPPKKKTESVDVRTQTRAPVGSKYTPAKSLTSNTKSWTLSHFQAGVSCDDILKAVGRGMHILLPKARPTTSWCKYVHADSLCLCLSCPEGYWCLEDCFFCQVLPPGNRMVLEKRQKFDRSALRTTQTPWLITLR